VGWSFSPLDEELGLLPQRYTPRLVEQIARLGTSCISFQEACALLSDLLGVEVIAETVRCITQAGGRHAVALETREAAKLRQSLAPPVVTVVERLQQVSVDGVMVPLLHGEWGEVKNLAIGRVEQTGEGPKAADLTYFARFTEGERFIAESRLEFWRRGTENARRVVAVNDGAEWIGALLDEHCPEAVRVIDWTHASDYVRAAGQACFGMGTADCVAWTKTYLELLWEGKVEAVIIELARLEDGSGEREEVRKAYQYLAKRIDQLRYAAFRAGGYPIGSGIVESANKGVVEARLKGAGKHWARDNVDPMLALRCAVGSQRWQERWREVHTALRRPHRHRPAASPPATPPEPVQPAAIPGRTYVPTFAHGKPTEAHPWK
jgi:hypothetical protein